MSFPKARPIAAVLAVAAIGVAAVLALSEHADDQVSNKHSSSPATPSTAAVAERTPARALSKRTLDNLKTYQGIEVAVATDPPSTTLDAAEAVSATKSQLHFVNDGGRVSEVALAKVTTTQQGVESSDRQITPDLDRRLVWVVVFDHVRVRVGGPQILDAKGQPVPQPPNVSHNAVMAVYVDPYSGKVFGAAQW